MVSPRCCLDSVTPAVSHGDSTLAACFQCPLKCDGVPSLPDFNRIRASLAVNGSEYKNPLLATFSENVGMICKGHIQIAPKARSDGHLGMQGAGGYYQQATRLFCRFGMLSISEHNGMAASFTAVP